MNEEIQPINNRDDSMDKDFKEFLDISNINKSFLLPIRDAIFTCDKRNNKQYSIFDYLNIIFTSMKENFWISKKIHVGFRNNVEEKLRLGAQHVNIKSQQIVVGDIIDRSMLEQNIDINYLGNMYLKRLKEYTENNIIKHLFDRSVNPILIGQPNINHDVLLNELQGMITALTEGNTSNFVWLVTRDGMYTIERLSRALGLSEVYSGPFDTVNTFLGFPIIKSVEKNINIADQANPILRTMIFGDINSIYSCILNYNLEFKKNSSQVSQCELSGMINIGNDFIITDNLPQYYFGLNIINNNNNDYNLEAD